MAIENKGILFFLLFLIAAGFLSAQEVIENPKKPAGSHAGRVISMDEIMRISDTDGDFYFKAAGDLKCGPHGEFFLKAEYQLLKFSSEGKFVGNYLKRGQGPGEMQAYFQYALDGGHIFMYDFMQRKIVQLDAPGRFVKEYKFSDEFNSFYGRLDGRFLMLKSTYPPLEEWTGKMMDMGHRVLQVSSAGGIEKTSPDFPVQAFLGQGFFSIWISFSNALDQERSIMYISHTGDYLIEALDLDKNQVIRKFRRKYPRVKYKPKKDETKAATRKSVPKRKFENDVKQLFFSGGKLWVVTSTKRKDKGTLIDVFDDNGRYVDNFYLPINGSLMAVQEDYVFVQEKDELENIEIVKYRIKRDE